MPNLQVLVQYFEIDYWHCSLDCLPESEGKALLLKTEQTSNAERDGRGNELLWGTSPWGLVLIASEDGMQVTKRERQTVFLPDGKPMNQ